MQYCFTLKNTYEKHKLTIFFSPVKVCIEKYRTMTTLAALHVVYVSNNNSSLFDAVHFSLTLITIV